MSGWGLCWQRRVPAFWLCVVTCEFMFRVRDIGEIHRRLMAGQCCMLRLCWRRFRLPALMTRVAVAFWFVSFIRCRLPAARAFRFCVMKRKLLTRGLGAVEVDVSLLNQCFNQFDR